MSLRRVATVLVLALFWTVGTIADETRILVSSAVSLREPLLEAIDSFGSAREPEQPEFQLQLAGSSTLAQQISRGAPSHIFLSASPRDMERLVEQGFARDVCTLASNRLVVVVARDVEPPGVIAELGDKRFERIAVANSKTAPLGRYTEQALRDAGLLPEIGSRLIPAEHARQAADYVARGEVDAAVLYATDAQRFAARVRPAFPIAANRHEPIEYQGALLSGESPAAAAFLEFLCSERATEIFERHGFTRWSGPR